MLDRRPIDWRKNPVGTAANIDHNFGVLFNAFEDLVNQKFETITLKRLSAESIFSGSTDLTGVFAPKHEHWLKEGSNISISGNAYDSTISVSKAPSFDRIYSGGTDLSSIFVARSDVREAVRPIIGSNLTYANSKNGSAIEVVPSPRFESVATIGLSADTGEFNNIIFKGRPLEELLPSYQLPESAPNLLLNKLHWGKNPNTTRQEINENFDLISRAFNTLLQHKLNDVNLDKVVAKDIVLCGSSLNDLFLPKNAHHDVVRIKAGSNITTGGTQNRPVISVNDKPVFSSMTADTVSLNEIILEGKNILDVFYTRKEARTLSHPELGDNLKASKDRGKNTIHVVSDPKFESLSVISATANTLSTGDIMLNGRPIGRLFGSHTFIQAGANMMTGGTAHNPVLSTVNSPEFIHVRSEWATISSAYVDALSGESSLFQSAVVLNDFSVSDLLTVNGNGVTLSNNLHLHDDRVTIGGDPELEVSSFLRTRVRILATQSSPIHYALIIQKKENEHKRVLNDDTVDFAVRGDGNVGIGAFIDISSKLTVKGEKGHDQLRLVTPFSPSSSEDENGQPGSIIWDDEYFYIKTSSGWKRAALDRF
jgi:hypothetical protein